MSYKDKISALATDEERYLVSSAVESFMRDAPSDYLTPREQALLFEALRERGLSGRAFFWGGAAGCERRRCIPVPQWIEAGECGLGLYSPMREQHFLALLTEAGGDYLLSEGAEAILLSGSGYRELGHRDWLGSILSLGLQRRLFGDIITMDERRAVVFCLDVGARTVLSELCRAGRDSVSAEPYCGEADPAAYRRFEQITVSVASPRLDGVVRALCGVSREEGAGLVRRGDVSLNYFQEKEPDTAVSAGDIISVKGYGKFAVDGTAGLTRRDRVRLSVRRYV